MYCIVLYCKPRDPPPLLPGENSERRLFQPVVLPQQCEEGRQGEVGESCEESWRHHWLRSPAPQCSISECSTEEDEQDSL